MFYVYVLRSKKDGKLYIGFTEDLRRRLKEHNEGINISTKSRRPFELVYYEAYKSQTDARKREIKLKLFKNTYTRLKQRLQESL